MLEAARGLVRMQYLRRFAAGAKRSSKSSAKRFFDTQLFWDKYARGKFAQYLFKRHDNEKTRVYSEEAAHHSSRNAAVHRGRPCLPRTDARNRRRAAGRSGPACRADSTVQQEPTVSDYAGWA
jgi:hypothetical protein